MKYLVLILFIPCLCAMTHEEKVGQVFIGFFYGETVDEETVTFFANSKLGNVVYFNWANGLESKGQVKQLSNEVQTTIENITGISPLIGVDQEGGRVARLRWFKVPSARERVDSGDIIGRELRDVGINLNFAPVVDVDSNPDNPIIGDRSFGRTPEVVIACASQMIDAFHRYDVLATLKHFPGHGDTRVDSHTGLPIVDKPLEEINRVELAPFHALCGKADAIMTAHVLYPALDPDHPATQSHSILTGMLRDKWGYEGVIISDSLTMRGIAPNQRTLQEAIECVTEAALLAFNAGCDLLIIGKLEWADFPTTREEDRLFMREVMTRFAQRVDESRLDDAVQRIMRLKSSRGSSALSYAPQMALRGCRLPRYGVITT